MAGVDLSEPAAMTYTDGADSVTEDFPTLAKAVEACKNLDPHIQITAVITTHSGTYDGEEIARLASDDGAEP